MLRVFTEAELPRTKAPAVHVVLRRGMSCPLRLPERSAPREEAEAEAAAIAPLRMRPALAQPTAFLVSKGVTLEAEPMANAPQVAT